MTYATTNPPILTCDGGIDGNLPRTWMYSSTDAAATVDGDGYFSDGQTRGMKVGDLVIVNDTTNTLITMHRVLSLSTSNNSVDLGAGTTVGSATDAD